MSTDFEVWFPRRPKTLAAEVVEGAGWMIHLSAPVAIEDVPASLRPFVGRCRYMATINFEGARPPQALAELDALLARLIAAHDARIADPQEDTVTDRSGTRRVLHLPKAAADTPDDLALVFCFENADRPDRDWLAGFLKLLESEFPEALPHRFGTVEPPEHRLETTGHAGFLELWDFADPLLWFGRTPVVRLAASFAFPISERQREWMSDEFRCGWLSLELRPRILGDPLQLARLIHVAELLAQDLDVFYAGLKPIDRAANWAWKGLLPGDHLLMILGRQYLELWPQFAGISRPLGNAHRLASAFAAPATGPIRPPAELAHPTEPIHRLLLPLSNGRTEQLARKYAQVFPFPKRDPYR